MLCNILEPALTGPNNLVPFLGISKFIPVWVSRYCHISPSDKHVIWCDSTYSELYIIPSLLGAMIRLFFFLNFKCPYDTYTPGFSKNRERQIYAHGCKRRLASHRETNKLVPDPSSTVYTFSLHSHVKSFSFQFT